MDKMQWDAPTRRIATVILGILVVYVFYLSRSVIPYLVIAALIAFLLVPIVDFLNQRLRIPRWLAVILAYLALVLAVLLVPMILLPALLNAFGDINIDLVAVIRDFLLWVENLLQSLRYIRILGFEYNLSPYLDPALETLRNITPSQFIPSISTIVSSIPSTIQFTWGLASNVLGTLASSLLAFILTLLYSVYLTVDGSKLIKHFIALAPPSYYAEMMKLHRRIKAIWSAYFRGQFLLALIIGVLTWLVGIAIGLPGALALGVIAGALEILPNLGPILAAIPALLVALVQGSLVLDVTNFYFMLIVMGAYVLIQQLENNLIVPKILGDAVELHPLFVMVGVVVGATAAGLLGALVAAPTIASARVLLAYTHAKILQQDPFPPVSTAPVSSPSLVERLNALRQKTVSQWQKLASTSKEQSDG